MDDGTTKALGIREVIEDKIQRQDYAAARTIILEALKTNPRLDKASEMLTVCEILCSADIELPKIGVDWYWVLQLLPTADAGTIEAQYQRVVSLLEPIKEDIPGAILALRFADDAYSVLSDPEKRAAFDSKRNGFRGIGEFSNSHDQRSTDTPSSSGPEMADNRIGDADVDEREKKIRAGEASCVTEQLSSKHNVNLQVALAASESRGLSSSLAVAPRGSEKHFYDFEIIRKLDLFSEGQVWAAYDQEKMPRHYARIDKIIPQKLQFYVTWFKPCIQSSHGKQWLDSGFPISCGNFVLELSKITLSELSMFSHMLSVGVTKLPLVIYPKKGEVWAIYRDWDVAWCSKPGMRKRCGFEVVEILSDYSKDSHALVSYLVKVDGFKNVFQRYTKSGSESSFHVPAGKLFMFSHRVPEFRFEGGEIGGVSKGMFELDPLALPDNLVQDCSCATLTPVDMPSRPPEEEKCSDAASFTHLPNPSASTMEAGELNSRIQNRKSRLSPKDILIEQVWAVYDGPDDLPRSYVKVIDVVSPTKVCVTFLEPHPMLDREIHWMEEGLPVGCGIFRTSGGTANLEISRFSHLVKCQRSSNKSFFRIFPQKGEVWAMYKNWSCSWKSSNLNRYQCQVVEIISDFSEENGSNICSLIEVNGYLTFFQREVHKGFQLTRQVSKLDMLSFSHRIPAFTVTGIKNHDIPEGSLHLEPDALPPKFIN